MSSPRISFDLDGVLISRKYMPLFLIITHALSDCCCEIGVLTGHHHDSGDKWIDRLEEMGYPRFDFYFGRRDQDLPFNGAVRKSQVIRDESIDFHFDDYDYDHPDTIRLFRELGVEDRIVRVHAVKETG